MKNVYELKINGKFSQYLMPSEVRLLKWDIEFIYTLTPVQITESHYKNVFGK